MAASNYQVRRAVIDDLPALRQLWRKAGFPVDKLEKRLTEFQVAVGTDQVLAGAAGIQLERQQGRIHSEVYHLGFDTTLQLLLWERLQSVARNHGLYRLWIQTQNPFWATQGFQESSPDLLAKLPATFGNPQPQWLVLQLREEMPGGISLDQEFEAFKQWQAELSEKTQRKARILRVLAAIVAIVSLLLVIGAMLYMFRHMPGPGLRR